MMRHNLHNMRLGQRLTIPFWKYPPGLLQKEISKFNRENPGVLIRAIKKKNESVWTVERLVVPR